MSVQRMAKNGDKTDGGSGGWWEGLRERGILGRKATFVQLGQENPCVGCPAPCCRMQLIPYKTPETFMDMDHMRYMLFFSNTEMLVTAAGGWFLLKWQDCREFEPETCICKVHSTALQPRICFSYNAYDCWYKKNFVGELPPQIYRLNLARFDVWVNAVLFDDKARIVSAPCFEESQQLLKAIPVEPTFQFKASMTKLQDVAVVSGS